ncbi:MAG TPA: copper-containing nitrite reductase [Cyclobacteriaceae bacterium]|nr:copper-containing nitrite reductase [Cyclobacteriaceae bacterium]
MSIVSVLKTGKFLTLPVLLTFVLISCQKKETPDNASIPVADDPVETVLTSPPHVPEPVGDRTARKLVVKMEIIEHEAEIADGSKFLFWTFGSTVPGPFIRARLGDEIEFHLQNHPDNKLPHNIDLHAVTGPGGGAEASFVAPGHEKVFSFKLINPGLFVYHCAAAPVGMHIGAGMYGLIMVEPRGGLPPVDREYYIMQGDFYTTGKTGEPGTHGFSMQKALDEKPDYVLFNGRVNALTGDNALTANVGETVRLFVGNGGPNLVSSFHVIGEIMDRVYTEGGAAVNENVQTTLIPAGGAAIVEFKVEVPGTLVLVDHSITRAFNKGALANLVVAGDYNPQVFSGEIMEGIYLPEGSVIQEQAGAEQPIEPPAIRTKEERIELGKNLYARSCIACHQADGSGLGEAFPPLAESDYLNADERRAIDIVLRGLTGEITVNGKKYNSAMPAQVLNDDEIASVLTFVYNSWGNKGVEITPQMVREERQKE